MSEHLVSISVVTYNSHDYIGQMLDSVHENVKNVNYAIYVIDNCSADNTVEIVKSKDYPVTLIENKQNEGFGKGHNKILGVINSKYHLIINADIMIDSDVISDMYEYMENNPDIGILTPKILYPNGNLQILPKRDPSFIYLLSRRINLRILRKYREKYEMQEMGADNTYDIEFCSGCFMFIRTELLKKVGGFDERYFLYFEDADLTRSIRKFARTQYNPNFVVYHHWERAGSKKIKPFLMQISSMLKYIKKWRLDKQK